MKYEILIKSFIRFDKLLHLLHSIQKYYPDVTIRVADDSPDNKERDEVCNIIRSMNNCYFYKLPFDVGLCVGRNFLLKKVKTAYFVLLDDDFAFTENTSLEKLQSVLQGDQDCIIAGGRCINFGRKSYHGHGHIEIRGNKIIRYVYGSKAPSVQINGVECVPCRMTQNFFMGNIALFRKHHIQWDERLKIKEHVWFFLNLPEELRIYYIPSVVVNHYPAGGNNTYTKFRYNKNELTKIERITGLKISSKRVILYESLGDFFLRALRKLGRMNQQIATTYLQHEHPGKRMVLAGVPLDLVTRKDLLLYLTLAANGDASVLVANVNIHAHNIAHGDSEFLQILHDADLVFCDGAGIVLGARLLGLPRPERLTPMDWIDEFAQLISEQGHSMFLLGNEPGVADKAAERFSGKFGARIVAGTQHGYFNKDGVENDAVIDAINSSGANILLVGMGMPLQEKWITKHRARLKPRVLLPVGALFGWYSGQLSRPPRWMTDNGMEWLGRLWRHPRRVWKRYLIGNPIFLARVIGTRIIGSWMTRSKSSGRL